MQGKTIEELEADFLAAMAELGNRDRRCYKPYRERLDRAHKSQSALLSARRARAKAQISYNEYGPTEVAPRSLETHNG
jgi:hypothetical protein